MEEVFYGTGGRQVPATEELTEREKDVGRGERIKKTGARNDVNVDNEVVHTSDFGRSIQGTRSEHRKILSLEYVHPESFLCWSVTLFSMRRCGYF